MSLQSIKTKQKKLLPIFIFTFFFLIYIGTSGGHGDPYDGLSYFLISENFVLNGSPSINVNSPSADELGFDVKQYFDIKSSLQAWSIYHSKAPDEVPEKFGTFRDEYKKTLDEENFFGPANLVLPVIGSSLYFTGMALNVSPIVTYFLFLNSIILAISCVVMFLIGKELFSEKIGFVLSIIFGVTSFIWPYITSGYARPLAILFLILFIYVMIRQRNQKNFAFSLLAGVFVGLSVLTHYNFGIFLPALLGFGIYEFRKNPKHMVLFLIPIISIVSLIGYINYEIRDDPINFGYLYFSQTDPEENPFHLLEGINGLLFSPGKTIFLYFPLTILYPFGMYYLFKKNKSFTIFLLILSAIIFLYQATSSQWYSNAGWGPHRYLLPLIPLLTIPIGSLIMNFSKYPIWKWGIIFFSGVGFIVNFIGNLVWVQYAYAYGWGPEGLWKVNDPDKIFTWDPYHSVFLQSIKVLSVDWISTLPTNPPNLDYFRVGLNGCTYDLFLFCEYGIIPIIIISGLLIVNFIIIMKLLNIKYQNRNFKTLSDNINN